MISVLNLINNLADKSNVQNVLLNLPILPSNNHLRKTEDPFTLGISFLNVCISEEEAEECCFPYNEELV